MRRGVAGVRLCHAAPCKYPAWQCPLHGMPVGVPAEAEPVTGRLTRDEIESGVAAVRKYYPEKRSCGCCGHSICSCPDPDWETLRTPLKLSEPEPPKDVLPEGWRVNPSFPGWASYIHASGATVWRFPGEGQWSWAVDDGPRRTKTTRELAMAAALQSVKPAEACEFCKVVNIGHFSWCPSFPKEPALREGWERTVTRDGETYTRPGHQIVFQQGAFWEGWRVFGDSNHATLEAALDRAEQLARGEPDDRDEPGGPDGYESAGAEFEANGGWSGL